MEHPSSHHSPGVHFLDWIPLILTITIGILYLVVVQNPQTYKGSWSWWRGLSFFIGILSLGVAMYPEIMQWAHHDLRGHMVQHLLLGMYAPIFLVLGAPLTLALKALPVKIARNVIGYLRSSIFYVVSHPFVAFFINIGGMYLFYLTSLYNESLSWPYLHYVTHLHFLVAGFLFTWSIIRTRSNTQTTRLPT